MRSRFVVVAPPILQGLPGLGKVPPPVCVEALVAQVPIEGLDERIIHWTPGPDKVQADLLLVRPGVEVPAGELAPVIESQDGRGAALGDDAVQHGRHPSGRHVRSCLERQALP